MLVGCPRGSEPISPTSAQPDFFKRKDGPMMLPTRGTAVAAATRPIIKLVMNFRNPRREAAGSIKERLSAITKLLRPGLTGALVIHVCHGLIAFSK